MNEITSQKMADPQFAEKFKEATGMTMEQYKSQVRLSQLSGKSLTSLAGHFKVGAELKQQASEEQGLSSSYS